MSDLDDPRPWEMNTRVEVSNLPGIVGLIVHAESECDEPPCVIHSPSDHHMADWLLNWRGDRRLMERICPHGIGHPDPDHLRYTIRTKGFDAAEVEAVHGCDGCCRGAYHSFLHQED